MPGGSALNTTPYNNGGLTQYCTGRDPATGECLAWANNPTGGGSGVQDAPAYYNPYGTSSNPSYNPYASNNGGGGGGSTSGGGGGNAPRPPSTSGGGGGGSPAFPPIPEPPPAAPLPRLPENPIGGGGDTGGGPAALLGLSQQAAPDVTQNLSGPNLLRSGLGTRNPPQYSTALAALRRIY